MAEEIAGYIAHIWKNTVLNFTEHLLVVDMSMTVEKKYW